MSNDLNLSIRLLADLDVVSKVTRATVDFDTVVEEFLKGLDVEDLVVDRLGAVDNELYNNAMSRCLNLRKKRNEVIYTFLVTFCPFLLPLSPPPPAVGRF